MPRYDFNEINVFDDHVDDVDIIKDIIKSEKPEDAFYVADIGDVVARHRNWINKMPKVIPHYGMVHRLTFVPYWHCPLLDDDRA